MGRYKKTALWNRQIQKRKKDEASGYLKESFVEYFKVKSKNKDEFDVWHEKISAKLVCIFNGYVRNNPKTNAPRQDKIGFTPGSAQKWINMTFKYIYCFDCIQINYHDHFQYCHMAIDRFTRDWLRTFNPQPAIANIGFSLIQSYINYFEAQKSARVESENLMYQDWGTCLFEKEFLIWEKYKDMAVQKANNKKNEKNSSKKPLS